MRQWGSITTNHPDGDDGQEFDDFVEAIVSITNFTEQQVRDYLARLDDDGAAPGTVKAWFESNPTVQAILNNSYQDIAQFIIQDADLTQLRRAIAFNTLVSKYMYHRFVDPPDEPQLNPGSTPP